MSDPLADAMRTALEDPTDVGLARLVDVHRPVGAASTPLIRTTWRALLDDRSLAAPAVAAIERSGVFDGPVDPRVRLLVEDLLSALGKWRHEPGRSLLVRLWTAPGELAMRAGHALLAFGDPAALQVVAAPLDQLEGGKLFFALQAVFTIAPAQAWDELAPRFAAPSARGGIVLDATLNLLMRDIWDDGRPHWGKTRGWFAADPRWLELCKAWQKLPPTAQRRQWGAPQTQRIVECAAWLRKHATPTC